MRVFTDSLEYTPFPDSNVHYLDMLADSYTYCYDSCMLGYAKEHSVNSRIREKLAKIAGTNNSMLISGNYERFEIKNNSLFLKTESYHTISYHTISYKPLVIIASPKDSPGKRIIFVNKQMNKAIRSTRTQNGDYTHNDRVYIVFNYLKNILDCNIHWHNKTQSWCGIKGAKQPFKIIFEDGETLEKMFGEYKPSLSTYTEEFQKRVSEEFVEWWKKGELENANSSGS